MQTASAHLRVGVVHHRPSTLLVCGLPEATASQYPLQTPKVVQNEFGVQCDFRVFASGALLESMNLCQFKREVTEIQTNDFICCATGALWVFAA